MNARNILLNLAESIYQGPRHAVENSAVASLLHAIDYLTDRIGYEMDPSPKGKVLLAVER